VYNLPPGDAGAPAEALERLAKGRTTFLVTDDLSLAATADEILYLEGGRPQTATPDHRRQDAEEEPGRAPAI
jgi:ABC-type transport system involved in cytochrome bd biosynthesis fused ATPase/permease subunit